MRISIFYKLSTLREVTSGVSQFSVLDSTLFLVYVNYVTGNLSFSYRTFTDDYKLYLRYPKERDAAAWGVNTAKGTECY